ncbi:MAG TPA: hypothetical protein P5074_14175 [Candidatus Nanopelagicales bacterium]|nr:hypothetical protein [Candidatus Nanopelagicales bacterium]
MKHRRHVVAAAAGIVGFVVGLQWVVLVEHLLLVANVVAVLALLALMGLYTRYTPWWTNPVGLSTMALKGALLTLGAGGLLRRIAEQLALAGAVHAPDVLFRVANHVGFTGWVLIAVSTVWRLTVMWPYLHRDTDRP